MRNTFLPSWWSRAATEQLSSISTRALSNTETLGTNTGKGNHNRKPKARKRIKFLTSFLSIFAAMVLGHSLELINNCTMRIKLSSVDPTGKTNMGTFMFDNVINRGIPSLAFPLDITNTTTSSHPGHQSRVISISNMSCPAANITGVNKSKDDFVWFAQKATKDRKRDVQAELYKYLKMFMDADTDNDGQNFLSKLIDMAGPIPRMNRNAPVDSELHKTEKKELARQHMFDSMDLKSTVVVTFDERY
jgi:hypothetical protein